jgi:hypothetical protein
MTALLNFYWIKHSFSLGALLSTPGLPELLPPLKTKEPRGVMSLRI